MARSVLAVIVGYAALLAVSAAIFTGAYFAVGVDAAFVPHSYEISTDMALCGLGAGLLAGAAGGWVCRAVSGTATAPRALVATAFVVTLASGVPMLARERPRQGRPPDVGRIDAMTRAFHPRWFTLLLPAAQAAGVWGVAGRRRRTPDGGAGARRRHLQA